MIPLTHCLTLNLHGNLHPQLELHIIQDNAMSKSIGSWTRNRFRSLNTVVQHWMEYPVRIVTKRVEKVSKLHRDLRKYSSCSSDNLVILLRYNVS